MDILTFEVLAIFNYDNFYWFVLNKVLSVHVLIFYFDFNNVILELE